MTLRTITPGDVTREMANFDGSRIAVHDPRQLSGGPLFAIVTAEDLRRLQKLDADAVVRCSRLNQRSDNTPTCPHCGEPLPPDGDDLDAGLNQTRFDDDDKWTPQNERNFRQAMRDAGLSVDDDADDDPGWSPRDEARYCQIMADAGLPFDNADEQLKQRDEYSQALDDAADSISAAMGKRL